MQFEDFFTADKAEEGVKVFLPNKFGEKTEHWMVLRHLHSLSYRRELALIQREIALVAENPDKAQRDAIIDAMPDRMFFSLIASWSFDTPLNRSNVSLLMEKAPYIKDFIDRRTADSSLFFRRESGNSSSTQEPAPGSKKGKKTAGH